MHRLIKRSITIVTTTVRRLTWYEPAKPTNSPKALANREQPANKEAAQRKRTEPKSTRIVNSPNSKEKQK